MAKGTSGPRRRTRDKLKKKGKITVNQFLEEFKTGEKVIIKIESSSHRGMPHPRFKGKYGMVRGKRGRAYIVEIMDGRMKKNIITTAEQLRHA